MRYANVGGEDPVVLEFNPATKEEAEQACEVCLAEVGHDEGVETALRILRGFPGGLGLAGAANVAKVIKAAYARKGA